MRALATILIFLPAFGFAQDAPRALPVEETTQPATPTDDATDDAPKAQAVEEPALEKDPGRDWFQHGRNVYESAAREEGKIRADLYQRSIDIFSRYLTDFPQHDNADAAWWYLGEAYTAIDLNAEAERCYHTLLRRFGKGRYAAAAAYKLGANHYNQRNYALAATHFETLAEIGTDPKSQLRGHFYAGKSHQLQNNRHTAGKHFKAIIEREVPENPYLGTASLAYGEILAQDGKLAEAIKTLDRVIKGSFKPDTTARAALLAGQVATRIQDTQRALNYNQLVIDSEKMSDFHPDAQLALMSLHNELESYENALKTYQLDIPEPSDKHRQAQRLMFAARAHMMLDQNADALQLFRQVERLQPPESQLAFLASYFRLLCFYRIEGKHVLDQVDAFIQLYSQARPNDPKIHTAQLMKAETLFAEGKTAQAAEAYRRIDPAKLSRKNRLGFHYQRGRCLAAANDHEGAIRSLTQFLEQAPKDDPKRHEALAARAKSLTTTGANTRALADYDRLLESSKASKLRTLAFFESARIAKSINELPTMIERYLSYLKEAPDDQPQMTAKASYWAGWGMVKTERGKAATPYLQRARKLAPDRYTKHTGLLLCLVFLAEKDTPALIGELNLAIENDYADELPTPLIRWAADQAYHGDQFDHAARFYDLIADEENPDLVSKDVWRFLAKAKIRADQPADALTALDHILKTEKDPGMRADLLNEKGRAHFMLEQYDDAMQAVKDGLALRVEGRIGASLHLLRGDILMAQNNPQEAIQAYIIPVELLDNRDRLIKPHALHQLVLALKQTDKSSDATKYQQQLDQNYPDWSPDH